MGKEHRFFGKHHTEETKQKLREATARQMQEGRFTNCNTKIELKIEQELLKQNIRHFKQKWICGISCVDFYLPDYKIIIYCDGDFWHKSDWAKQHGVVKKDNTQDLVLGLHGYTVFRFTGTQIRESAKKCINKVKKHIQKGEIQWKKEQS
jgi:very-short-patch-repair endonuclease